MKRLWLILMGLSLLLMGCAEAEDTALYPIRENEKWGYMDRTGNVVIPPQWDDAGYFSGGVALVSNYIEDPDGMEWLAQGLINARGETLLEPRYYMEDDGGIIVVTEYFPVEGAEEYEEYTLDGYYDKASGFFLTPRYDFICDGGPGFVMFSKMENGGEEGIDGIGFLRADTGEEVIPNIYEWAFFDAEESAFSEGFALLEVSAVKDDPWLGMRLLDENGAEVLFPEGIAPWDPVHHGALVITWADERPEYGLARPDGTVILEPSLEDIGYVGDGFYGYQKGDACGLLSADGRFLTDARFDSIYYGAADGLARVREKTEEGDYFLLIDRTGRTVFSESTSPAWDTQTPGQTDPNSDFWLLDIIQDSGLVIYRYSQGETPTDRSNNIRYGLIAVENGRADYLTGPVFEEIGYKPWELDGFISYEGLLGARQNGRWGYIDRQGQFSVQPIWSEVGPFRDGLARVYDEDGNMAYIDRQGRVIWQESAQE